MSNDNDAGIEGDEFVVRAENNQLQTSHPPLSVLST